MLRALIHKTTTLPGNLYREVRSEAGWKFLLLLAINLALFWIFKNTALRGAEGARTLAIPVACVFALVGMRVHMSDFILPMRIVLRTIFGLFTLYILGAHATFDITQLSGGREYLFEPGRYIFAILALGACFIPSLGLIPITYIIWFKKTGAQIFHLSITPTDYMPLIEMAALFIIMGVLWHYFKRRRFWAGLDTVDENTLTIGEKLFLAGIASHMLNYYYSALAKVRIGDTWLDWALHNPTHFLLMTSQSLGQLPMSFSDQLVEFSFQVLEQVIVPVNLLLFFGQLLAIVALLRIRWGIIAMLFYDLTHFVIFFTSGIFFYKWITLNLSIVFALRTMLKKTVTPLVGLVTIVIVLIGPFFFFTARLGWWDTPIHNIEYMSAVTKDGRDIRIPSNFWGNMSVTAAQQRLIWGKGYGWIPTSTYGITMSQRTMEKAMTCDFEIPPVTADKPTGTQEYFNKPDNDVTNFVRQYHHWVLQRAGDRPNILYDLFPHHIFSSPWEFMDFYHLNLRDIVAYRYNLRATCLQFENGHIVSRLLKEEHHDIPVQ